MCSLQRLRAFLPTSKRVSVREAGRMLPASSGIPRRGNVRGTNVVVTPHRDKHCGSPTARTNSTELAPMEPAPNQRRRNQRRRNQRCKAFVQDPRYG